MLRALADSNVLVAALIVDHDHHDASQALFEGSRVGRLAVASHSYAEAFVTLTRQGKHGPYRLTPAQAWAGLESIAAATNLLGLSPSQTFSAVRGYAESGAVGARLYDRLIGEVAMIHGLQVILTWNLGHMRGLFPTLDVMTPKAFLAR